MAPPPRSATFFQQVIGCRELWAHDSVPGEISFAPQTTEMRSHSKWKKTLQSIDAFLQKYWNNRSLQPLSAECFKAQVNFKSLSLGSAIIGSLLLPYISVTLITPPPLYYFPSNDIQHRIKKGLIWVFQWFQYLVFSKTHTYAPLLFLF